MGVGSRLESLTREQVLSWAEAAQDRAQQGTVNQRIPALARCQPDWFSLQIDDLDRTLHGWGEIYQPFALMSVVKPFLLLYLLEQYGSDQVFTWVGIDPSDRPFNDLNQLKADGGHPRNPMINSGALTLAGKLPGSDPVAEFKDWLNQRAGCQLWLDAPTLESVRQGPRQANLALLDCLVAGDRIQNPDQALDAYEQICCFSTRIDDLARLGRLLAFRQGSIQADHRRTVNALMLTCGLYEASAHHGLTIGLPIKSGISGAMLAIVPNQGVIATYGPALDAQGNSVAGLAFVTQLAQALGLSVFGD
ncbi:glutaminase A [filamentous cyanobacterium CCP5]|nr:glutaminase A [filamentous cyanobacterium CCP5]